MQKYCKVCVDKRHTAHVYSVKSQMEKRLSGEDTVYGQTLFFYCR